MSASCRDLIDKLLTPNPLKRLGHRGAGALPSLPLPPPPSPPHPTPTSVGRKRPTRQPCVLHVAVCSSVLRLPAAGGVLRKRGALCRRARVRRIEQFVAV